ncbi:50S ribosomal protein L20 [Aerococcus urinaeequi]|jgi:large subunit ribosomal protein L20|uniref:Large ribosomal subunit protein bL20 n=2 Tax=Aerococcus viridans TaxID=1377 RepID=A0A2J9PKZ3_9LACT|nr:MULTISPECIES: 50S ribosomal protein L20 [Aerococcus]AMC00644.1 50S ribosomal protein L20 [Aerococcus viridans]EFG50035.1 ribosomal protein L20 [Aerococcus viridans ATCC 11563 = CCUG 4311]MCT1797912.1 50S ribosomal protein L20 [Aerococcus viridans]OFU51238.1 50S ribosomal protein L20 [Aerococcus sp. HMSC10H05]PMC79468.1 50S ribosomal protein L20 [Aerococcus viridans]
MARVKGGTVTRRRRKKYLKLSKGYFGAKSKLYKTAKQAVMKSYTYAYRDRRQKKRDFRRLWITRINAAARMNGMSYSTLINGLKVANIDMNRKMLAELAVNDADAFAAICEQAKAALNK